MGTSSWDPSRDAIAEVLIASHGFESTLRQRTVVKPCRADSKPWLAIKTSAIAVFDGPSSWHP